MYTNIPQSESQADEDSVQYTDLYRDHKLLERRFQQLRLWNYFLTTCSVLCLGLLSFDLRSSSLVAKSFPDGQVVTPVRQSKYLVNTVESLVDLYANHSNPASDSAWAALMPTGDGFIVVNEPEEYNLQPGVQTPQGPQYDITVFHQLHCLTYIRTFMYTVLDLAQHGVDNEGARYFVDHPDDHIFHCFDYLRQGLMCSADLTVEWPREEKDGSRFAVDGWGIEHQCKNWDAIMRFMEENRFHQPWELDPQWSPEGRG